MTGPDTDGAARPGTDVATRPGPRTGAGPGGMDSTAAGGFSAAAGHYARSRPAYARPAIGLLKDRLAGGPVLDLAAGTGILTGQLHRARVPVLAAEPVASMLAQLRLSLPEVPAVQATAEALPFGDRTLGGVTVAQAFHWFDAPVALAELARVLRPGGTLAMVWNLRDESVPWVAALTDLIERRSGGRPHSERPDRRWEEVVAGSGRFGPVETATFPNPVASSPDLLAARVRSTSFVAAMDPEARESLLGEVADMVAASPDLAGRARFEYPHDTTVHLCPVLA
jgi:SAM-dependent methyltransferase